MFGYVHVVLLTMFTFKAITQQEVLEDDNELCIVHVTRHLDACYTAQENGFSTTIHVGLALDNVQSKNRRRNTR